MAEIAGLAIAIAALAGSFKDCVELFEYFSAARSFSEDFEILATKFDVEKTLLLQWADRVGLFKEEYDARFQVVSTQKAVAQILASIKLLLSNGTELKQSYGVKESSDGQMVKFRSPISARRMAALVAEFQQMEVRLSKKREDVSSMKKLRWVVHDKVKFDKLIADLAYFVSKLHFIIPDQAHMATAMSQLDIRSLGPRDLRLLRSTLSSTHTALADAAEQSWVTVLEKRILDSLWFRAMGDRKASIAPQHVNTFEWALKSHHGFLNWLEYEDGIYWISGKPASGKSTLMKYLFIDSRTKAKLQTWAGEGSGLTMASFFLWNAGTEEQKSQTGVARAFLFQFLESNRSLIPTLLPGMWRELDKSASPLAVPGPPIQPSKEELREAFTLLRSHYDPKVKFCLFLDGLDELSGDLTEGIALVKSLSSIGNVKIIVSSRPIALCEDAFSAGPKLRLQDLTKGDISLYVHDHIGSHPQMMPLRSESPGAATRIINEVIDRASGVFLWVVLACKSVKEGFAKSDSIEELQNRVRELPAELEELFAHILSKIEPRYQEEAARILKVAYHQRLNGWLRPLCNFGLSVATAIANCPKDLPALVVPTVAQRNSRSRAIEGRLRSRCWGLLETNPFEDLDHCLAATDHNSPHRKVDFMHRTVFEFLANAETWKLPSLRVNDDSFDSFSVLSWMALNLFYLILVERLPLLDDEVDSYAAEIIEFARNAAKSSFKAIQALLVRLVQIACEFHGLYPAIDMFSRIALSSENMPLCSNGSVSLTVLVLAIEAGMPEFVQKFLQVHNVECSSVSSTVPLLRCALFPKLWPGKNCEPSPEIVTLLLNAGCNPNQIAFDSEVDAFPASTEVTPWRLWIPLVQELDISTKGYSSILDDVMLDAILQLRFQSVVKITRLMVNAGADLQILDDILGEPLEDVLNRSSPLIASLHEVETLHKSLRQRRKESHANRIVNRLKQKKRGRAHDRDDSSGSDSVACKRRRMTLDI